MFPIRATHTSVREIRHPQTSHARVVFPGCSHLGHFQCMFLVRPRYPMLVKSYHKRHPGFRLMQGCVQEASTVMDRKARCRLGPWVYKVNPGNSLATARFAMEAMTYTIAGRRQAVASLMRKASAA